MGQMDVFSPAGHKWQTDPFCKQPMQEMTVGQFIEELLKGCPDPEYTKDNIRVVVEDKPLYDESALLTDCGILSETAVQKLRKVDEIKSGISVQMVRKVNGG